MLAHHNGHKFYTKDQDNNIASEGEPVFVVFIFSLYLV